MKHTVKPGPGALLGVLVLATLSAPATARGQEDQRANEYRLAWGSARPNDGVQRCT